MCKKSPAKFLGIGIFFLAAIAALGAVTMLLWNWLITTLFNGPILSYAQALGLLVLSKILFSGGTGKHERHSGTYPGNLPWKQHLKERMEARFSTEEQPASAADPATD